MTHVPRSRLETFADFLIRNRLMLLFAGILITAVAAIPASRLTFDRSIESLYAPDDPHLLDYLESKLLFGGDEFVVVAYGDSRLLTEDGLQRIRRFSERLSRVPGVETDATQNLVKVIAARRMPWLLRLVMQFQYDALLELTRGVFLGEDGETTAIILRLLPAEETPVPRSETFSRIRELADAHNPPAYVVGQPIQVYDMFRYIELDGRLLFRVSLALLALVIFLLFRSFRWVILPLMVVMVTIVWTEAVLVLSRIRLSMVSSMLNSLITIIGVATVMHVTIHFRHLRRERRRIEALRLTIIDLAPAVFWTCATTAAGFAALLSSQVTPVRSFGLMMGLGSLTVLFAVATLLPGGVLLGRFGSDVNPAPGEDRLTGLLTHIARAVQRHPRLVAAAVVVFLAFATIGLSRLRMETSVGKNFRASTPIVQSMNFVEARLGGAGMWEVHFPAPRQLTPQYLDRVRSLKQRLERIGGEDGPRLTKAIALTDVLDLIPDVPLIADATRLELDAVAGIQPQLVHSLYNETEGRMRMILRAREQQSTPRKIQLIETVDRVAHEEFQDAKTTGLFVLLAYIIESLMRDQVVSLALAAAGIGGMMTLAFRSLRIGLMSLVPNLFPIAVVVGTMGWIGLPINIGTAMIASVSVGLTVDFSIHYLFAYRRARAAGCDHRAALEETNRQVGQALVFVTFSLIAGFSVLSLSHFIPLVHFGLLVSAAMLGGLIGNLGLLPLLLGFVERDK